MDTGWVGMDGSFFGRVTSLVSVMLVQTFQTPDATGGVAANSVNEGKAA